MTEITNVGEIIGAAQAAADVKWLDEDQALAALVVPADGRVELVDVKARLDKYLPAPERATGTHTTATVKSFTEFVARHHGPDLVVWVHPTSGRIVAVLNDHAADQAARWGDHRVVLTLEQTEAWKRWAAHDGKLLEQQAFAEHIEEGLTEIAYPAGAELLEIAQTMHGTTSAAWKAGVSLHDGSVKFGYTEDASARAGNDGELVVPQDFTLLMPVFVGEAPVQVDARLRWRARGGSLMLGYKLVNPVQIVQDVLQDVADRLGSEFADSVFLGSPRS